MNTIMMIDFLEELNSFKRGIRETAKKNFKKIIMDYGKVDDNSCLSICLGDNSIDLYINGEFYPTDIIDDNNDKYKINYTQKVERIWVNPNFEEVYVSTDVNVYHLGEMCLDDIMRITEYFDNYL